MLVLAALKNEGWRFRFFVVMTYVVLDKWLLTGKRPKLSGPINVKSGKDCTRKWREKI